MIDSSSNPTGKHNFQSSSVPSIGDNTTVEKRGKMHYTELGSANCGSEEQINFYGVIIDAGHPYKAPNKWICTMKIIDQTLNSKVEGANSFIQHGMITFFAKKPEDLPVARKIGDIVRVHRAVVREYKGRK